jgi:hypothetical protein
MVLKIGTEFLRPSKSKAQPLFSDKPNKVTHWEGPATRTGRRDFDFDGLRNLPASFRTIKTFLEFSRSGLCKYYIKMKSPVVTIQYQPLFSQVGIVGVGIGRARRAIGRVVCIRGQ